MTRLKFLPWLLAAVFLAGGSLSAAVLNVATTTTLVTDLVQRVGGERVKVQGLMGPGVDPHVYQTSPSDVRNLRRAKVIFYSGLHLEGRIQDLFVRMSGNQKHIYPVTASIPVEKLLASPDYPGQYDPHVWFDAQLWGYCLEAVAQGLSAADPAGKNYYEKRAAEERRKFEELHHWLKAKVSELPPEKRILVTSHDAFNYFGRAYDFQVVGLQGTSTVSEAGLADMALMVDFIRKNRVKAVFVESSVSPQAIRRISQDAAVRIGGELFSDAMGSPGQILEGFDVGAYEGMMKYNVHTIVEALK
jgi:manganese/zinc/iron transport system substrate-binding protein